MKHKLKPVTPYGVSGSPHAYRPHIIDPELSQVTFKRGRPETTQYRLRWMCGSFSLKYSPRFLMEVPAEIELCRACRQAKVNREYLLGVYGVSFENLYKAMYGYPRDLDKLHAVMMGKPFSATDPFRPQNPLPPF